MRIVVSAFALLAVVATRSISGQPTLLAIENGEFSFLEPIMNESGEAFAILGFSLVHQDGADLTPNPILTVEGSVGADTLKLIHTDPTGPRPLAPVFGSDDVLVNARIERPDTTQVNSLLIVSPAGAAVDHIDGDNPALFFTGETPTDKEFGMQSARSYLGDSIPGNQIERIIGFATAQVDTQTNGPSGTFIAAFGAGSMQVITTNLGFRPTRIETHGAMKSSITASDLQRPIGPPVLGSAPAFEYGYSNVNGPGSFVLPPAGTGPDTLGYAVSVLLAPGSSESVTRIDTGSIIEALARGRSVAITSDIVTFLNFNSDSSRLFKVIELILEKQEELDDSPSVGGATLVAGSASLVDSPAVADVAGIKPGPFSTDPAADTRDCDCDARIDPSDPVSRRVVDVNGDGRVDIEDDVVMSLCIRGDPSGVNCRDVNGNGKIDFDDFRCVARCVDLEPTANNGVQGRVLDPTLVRSKITVIHLTEGQAVPDRPQLTMGSATQGTFGLTRAHTNGFALFGVRAFEGETPSAGKILLIALAPNGPPKTVFEEGVDYGDGVVATIPGNGVSNINRAGQFAVVAILESGETAIYRIQIEGGFPPPPNTVRRDWQFYL